jgi:DNA adenine methylase
MFRYPGGKRKLVQLIWDRLRRLHPNGTYCEPFAGGAAVALEVAHWCPGDRIILNDLDPGIAAIWNAVLHHPDELKTAIMNFTPSVEAYREIRTYLTNGGATEGGVETAWRKLAVHQTSYSGKGEASSGFSPLGGYHQRSADRIDQYWNRSALCRKVDQLHNLLIGRTECHAADFEQFLSRPDDCLLYLDPPYYEAGSELYLHTFREQDHRRLAAALREMPNCWVLSYDDHPVIRELYGDWAVIEEVENVCSIARDNGGPQQPRKMELLITSAKSAPSPRTEDLGGLMSWCD